MGVVVVCHNRKEITPVKVKAEPTKAYALIQGASRGIGLALVDELLESNADQLVIATCRNPSSSDGLKSLIKNYGERLKVFPLDPTVESSAIKVAETLAKQPTSIELLINCTGILHHSKLRPEKRIDDINIENLIELFKVNSISAMLAIKHLRKFLLRDSRSVIVNLSARVGSISDNCLGGWYGYRSSKAALNQLTKTLSIELQRNLPLNVCVALHPGTVDTQLSQPFQSAIPKEKIFTTQTAARQILDVISKLNSTDTGSFIAWDGSKVPW
jgi:NAD(P)-dependent dehydrogenase (short-subunit alcohol dehydrogenase family)